MLVKTIFLTELLEKMDAMKDKRLVADTYIDERDCRCIVGLLVNKEKLCLAGKDLDPMRATNNILKDKPQGVLETRYLMERGVIPEEYAPYAEFLWKIMLRNDRFVGSDADRYKYIYKELVTERLDRIKYTYDR